MNASKLVGLVLIVGGALSLVFGFSYTKDSSALKLGPLELSVKQKESINVPLWAGVAAASTLVMIADRLVSGQAR
nr:hypothetical protein [Methylibium sp.]